MEAIVNLRTVYFLAAVAIFLVSLAALGIYYYFRGRKTSRGEWEDLLQRLVSVDRDHVALIALDIIDETGAPRKDEEDTTLEPSQIWTLIGGLEGLERLERNCYVLIDMAFYVQQWYPEALVVAELLRLNAREIAWHVSRLKGAAQTGNLEASFPAYAQRAIATYYLMTRRVLTLYELGNLPMFVDLQKAL
jgi:hypothetical protein